MNNLRRNTITSMEVAEMVGKKHCDLLRDIRKYVDQLGESKIAFTDFFKEATYTTEQNKILPCFQVTKKGCEFIAHKLTGQKRNRIYCEIHKSLSRNGRWKASLSVESDYCIQRCRAWQSYRPNHDKAGFIPI